MTKFWHYDNISAIHIELSSKCNAACPGCPRYARNSPNIDANLVETEITLEQFQEWFPRDLVSRIHNWIICGTHGDPMTCSDLYEILEYICHNGTGNVQVNTNGGIRNEAYYKKIGELFVEDPIPKRVIIFSIDGLEDTNHIYRRNVRWHKVWENMLGYRSTGAETHWDFLRFHHNVHQIDEAKTLANKYDIKFILKNPFGVDSMSMPVYDEDFKLQYLIKNADNPIEDTYIPAPIGWEAEMPQLPTEEGFIECNSFRNGYPPYEDKEFIELYVNALGNVHPCCYVGNKMQGAATVPEAKEMQELQKKLGTTNSLHHNTLKKILDNKVLSVYSDSWKNKTLSQCWVQCGKNVKKERRADLLFYEGKNEQLQ